MPTLINELPVTPVHPSQSELGVLLNSLGYYLGYACYYPSTGGLFGFLRGDPSNELAIIKKNVRPFISLRDWNNIRFIGHRHDCIGVIVRTPYRAGCEGKYPTGNFGDIFNIESYGDHLEVLEIAIELEIELDQEIVVKQKSNTPLLVYNWHDNQIDTC